MNNMTSNFAAAMELRQIGSLYMFYVGIFNLVLGLVGNVGIILVFKTLKIFSRNQSAFYLVVESISNIGLLLAIYMSIILSFFIGFDPVLVSITWCKIRIMLVQGCGLCSVYTVSFAGLDQYLATNLRASYRQKSNIKLAYRLTFVNIVFATLHSITFLIYFDIQSNMGCTVYNPIIKQYFTFFYYPFLISFLPMLLTITFSTLAFYNVRHLVRLRVPVIRRRLEHQMTAIVLSRVLFLTICGIPFLFATIAKINVDNHPDNYNTLAIVNMFTSVCYTLLYTNFSMTFYILLVVSSRFRRQFKIAVVKLFHRIVDDEHQNAPKQSQGNRIVPQIVVQSSSGDGLN